MTLEDKIKIIEENRSPAIAALDSIIDLSNDMYGYFFDENTNVLKDGLQRDEKAENFIKEIKSDVAMYENLRSRLAQNDFNLSPAEVASVALTFYFAAERMKQEIVQLEKAISMSEKIFKDLSESTN